MLSGGFRSTLTVLVSHVWIFQEPKSLISLHKNKLTCVNKSVNIFVSVLSFSEYFMHWHFFPPYSMAAFTSIRLHLCTHCNVETSADVWRICWKSTFLLIRYPHWTIVGIKNNKIDAIVLVLQLLLAFPKV